MKTAKITMDNGVEYTLTADMLKAAAHGSPAGADYYVFINDVPWSAVHLVRNATRAECKDTRKNLRVFNELGMKVYRVSVVDFDANGNHVTA
ncbi:hypothetical protein ACWCYZ_40020 [Streptomyces virginiae]